MYTWNSLKTGTRVELGLLQIDIAGHSKLEDTDAVLKAAKDTFKQLIKGIAETRHGRLFNWAGDGGCFMFLVQTGEGYNDMGFSAKQMLSSLPSINEEITIRTGLADTLSVRISCDSGMAVYDTDPSQISGDFINKFLKNERQISITNTVSITERVWKQLLATLRQTFKPFKYSDEVLSKIYNFGGKDRQIEILKSLHNIDRSEGMEKPYEFPECVEILAFMGDTLLELSKHAYADVIVSGFENVGGINLLATKNAQRCRQHIQQESPRRNERNIERPRQQVVNGDYQDSEDDYTGHSVHEDKPLKRDPAPTEEFEGGESLRFYNCTALGYAPIIGDGTLLDHVFAKQVLISRVVAGVPEPAVKQRVFEMVNNTYQEIVQEHEGNDKN